MPFIEIQGPPLCREARAALARATTDALVAAYAIDPDIVTTYFIDVVPGSYAHGRALGDPDEVQRVFVKVYAFRRPIARRRAAARTITDAICRATGWAGTNVVVYFLEVAPAAAAHAGRLHSDHTN